MPGGTASTNGFPQGSSIFDFRFPVFPNSSAILGCFRHWAEGLANQQHGRCTFLERGAHRACR
jgi:hypothetical protein